MPSDGCDALDALTTLSLLNIREERNIDGKFRHFGHTHEARALYETYALHQIRVDGAIATAGYRISSGYVPGRAVASSTQELEPPLSPGRFSLRLCPSAAVLPPHEPDQPGYGEAHERYCGDATEPLAFEQFVCHVGPQDAVDDPREQPNRGQASPGIQ